MKYMEAVTPTFLSGLLKWWARNFSLIQNTNTISETHPSIHPSTEWVPWVKRPRHEADHTSISFRCYVWVESHIHSYIRLHDVHTDLTKMKTYITECSEHLDPISAVRVQHTSQEIHVQYPSATDQHKYRHNFLLIERNFGAKSDKTKSKGKVHSITSHEDP